MKKPYVFIVVATLVAMGSCSDDDPSPDNKQPFVNLDVAEIYKGTQSPGDVWTWVLDKEQEHMTATWDYGTFDDTSDDITIEGTFETLPSGFLKVTIINTEPSNNEIPVDGSAWFYALEIPGMAMIIKPEGTIKGDIIAMVPEGNCADIAGTYNYVVSAPGGRSSYNPITQEAFGYLEIAESGNGLALSGYKWSLDCVNGGNCTDTGIIQGIPNGICTDNGDVVITDGGGTVAVGRFTSAGTMMIDFGKGKGGAFALKTSEQATKASLLDNDYMGLVYMPKNQNDNTLPVKLSFFENDLGYMIGTAHPYANVETGEVDNDNGVVVLVHDVVNGRVFGTLNFDNDNDESSMGAALLVDGNQQILILTSYGEDDLNPFILVLVKQ